jgi:hypothetical protein
MKAGSILNADMATIGRWLREAVDWWLDELRELIPARGRGRQVRDKADAIYDGHAGFRTKGALPAGRALTIELPAGMCLVREIALPSLRKTDLRRLVMLDLDRLFPLPSDSIHADVALLEREGDGGRMRTGVAALPKESALQVAAAAEEAGFGIGALRFGAFDFLPALQADGVVPHAAPAGRFWWAVVAVLFLANVGLLIGRDMQNVASLEALVDTQGRAASAARSIAQRVAAEDRARALWARRHEARDPIVLLAGVTRAAPEGAWVQRFAWSGNMLRLAGYKQGTVDMVGSLRRAPVFVNVRASSSDAPAEVASGQPFDVSAELRGAR